MNRPADLFDRDREWGALASFMAAPADRSRFGIVYGRRRQGKSFLLERFAAAAGGIYWESFEGSARDQLDELAHLLRDTTGAAVAPALGSWEDAFLALRGLDAPLVVLDEFQYVVDADPSAPSRLQRLVSRPGGPRIIVCGSALGAMRSLVAPDGALRGRAALELVVQPFDFRTSARYWGLEADLDLALQVHAIVGGTPAYLDFAAGRGPTRGFDSWMVEVVLDPAGALLREGQILVGDTGVRDRAIYTGVLAAIAGGATRRSEIAGKLGRAENTLAHPLNHLVALELVERRDDPLRRRRSTFHIADPLLRLQALILHRLGSTIERSGAGRLWPTIAPRVHERIVAPHFEELVRRFVADHAAAETLGGLPELVAASVVSDPATRTSMELDLVAAAGQQVLAIGEAKWQSQPTGTAELSRLERCRHLLDVPDARLVLASRCGFSAALEAAAASRPDVVLVGLDRLYHGE